MLTRSQIDGALWGLLVGDALGVPYEFHARQAVPPLEQIEFEPPSGFDRAHRPVPVGTWSDDGAQALCLLASLLNCGRLELDDFGRRLLNWYDYGYMAVDDLVFDVGVQTATALHALATGVAAAKAGPVGERDNGNGSLMRVLPLALWHRGSDEELIRDARLQSLVTHGHVRAQLCCALYCLWARYIVRGAGDAWAAAVERLRSTIRLEPGAFEELEWSIRPDRAPEGAGSGYVVDCLHSARLASAAGSYERVVKTAVSLGSDTDTTAAVAGGIAGLRDGVEAIPRRWLEALRGRELVVPLLQGLYSWHGC